LSADLFLRRYIDFDIFDPEIIIPWLNFDGSIWESISSAVSSQNILLSKSFVINFDLVKNPTANSTINGETFTRNLFYYVVEEDNFKFLFVFELQFDLTVQR
jgi:hypothetical protein